MPELTRNWCRMGTPRRKTYQRALAENPEAGQKIQVCRSSQSTRLTHTSALGLSLSKRLPPAQQLAFCAAQHSPVRARFKESSPFHLASSPRVGRALWDSRSVHTPIDHPHLSSGEPMTDRRTGKPQYTYPSSPKGKHRHGERTPNTSQTRKVRMEKLRLREGQRPAPGHTASQERSFTTTPASGSLSTTQPSACPQPRRRRIISPRNFSPSVPASEGPGPWSLPSASTGQTADRARPRPGPVAPPRPEPQPSYPQPAKDLQSRALESRRRRTFPCLLLQALHHAARTAPPAPPSEGPTPLVTSANRRPIFSIAPPLNRKKCPPP